MWRKIKLTNDVEPNDAYVTIGNGQMHFGIAACKLIPNCIDMPYVEFFRGDDAHLIGVAMVTTESEDSVPIRRPRSTANKGEDHVKSFSVISNNVMRKVFGDVGVAPTSVKCKVRVDDDAHNMFIIDMNTQREAKTIREEVS